MKNFLSSYFERKIEITIVFLILFFSVGIQLFVVPSLPEKYFYDSNKILRTMEYLQYGGNGNFTDSTFVFIGKIFNTLNIFDFSEFYQWSILILPISSLFNVLFFLKYKKISIYKWIFIYMTLALCNMYIYRISKEIVQVFFWIIIYLIINSKVSEKMKLVLSMLILLTEGYFFRVYYYIIGAALIPIYIFLNIFKKINVKKAIIVLFLGVFIGLNILKIANVGYYNIIINLRTMLNRGRSDSIDAVTIINDVLPNNNVILYICNYFINLLRFIFPFELLFKGKKYILFIIYQLMLMSFVLFKIFDNRKDVTTKMYLSLIISYILTSNLFEPDFGSLIRHEITMYVIYIDLFLYNNKKISCIESNELLLNEKSFKEEYNDFY